jgi:hypothetical protein
MGCDIHPHFETKNEQGKWERLVTRRDELMDLLYGPDSEKTDEEMTQEERDKLLEEMWEHPLDIGRNYDLFAILADVRNGRGFAGVVTGTGFDPISNPRGLPRDVSNDVINEYASDFCPKRYAEGYTREMWEEDARKWVSQGYSAVLTENPLRVSCPDWHSTSWYTLKELLDYDWDAKTTTQRGIVCQSAYAAWDRDKPGFPDNMASMVFGSCVEQISEAEMQERIRSGLPEEEEITKMIDGEVKIVKVCYYCEVTFELRYSDCCRHFVDKVLPFLRGYADSSFGGDYERVRFVFWFDN